MSDERVTAEDWVALVLAFPVLVWEAFVAARLWLWFAVPLGAPVLATLQVAGLRLLWMAAKGYRPTPKPEQSALLMLFTAAALATVFLGMGAVAHWWSR